MTSSGDAATAPFQTTVCPHCGARVPGASYCGACGAHLTHARRRGAARRAHAYSAFPDESVFRLAVVSSLLPQLAGRSRDVYRITFALIVVVLAAVAVAGLDAPVIAISALAVPLLFLIYVWEIDPLEVRFAVPTAAIFVAGARARGRLGAAARPARLRLAGPPAGRIAHHWRRARVRAGRSRGRPTPHGAAGRGGAAVAAGPQRSAGRLYRRGRRRAGPDAGRHAHPAGPAAAGREPGRGLIRARQPHPGGRPRAWPTRSSRPLSPGTSARRCGAGGSRIGGRRPLAHQSAGGAGVRPGPADRPRLRRRCGPSGHRPARGPPRRGGGGPAVLRSACIMCCCTKTGTCGSARPVSARTATGSCPRCRSARCAASPSAPPG